MKPMPYTPVTWSDTTDIEVDRKATIMHRFARTPHAFGDACE